MSNLVYRIYIGNTLSPKAVIVEASKTLAEIYSENNLPIDGIITLNGEPLDRDAVNLTLRDLNVKDGDILTTTKKYASA